MRRLVVVGVAVVVLGLVAVLAVVAERRVGGVLGRVTGLGPDCTVARASGEGPSVDLTRDQAEAVSAAAAPAVRRGWRVERARPAVTGRQPEPTCGSTRVTPASSPPPSPVAPAPR